MKNNKKIFLGFILLLLTIAFITSYFLYCKIDKQLDFNNEIKCQTMLKDLAEVYKNINGIYYNKQQNTCIVRYVSADGPTEEKPLRDAGKK